MNRVVTLAGYAMVALAAVALEVRARRQRRPARLADALDTALGVPLVRVVLAAGWLWLGWHLFVRTDWR